MPQLNCTSCHYCGDLPIASALKVKNFCPVCNSPLKRVVDANSFIAVAVYLLVMIEFTRVDPNSPMMFWLFGGVGLLAIARFQKYANNISLRE